MSAGGPEHELRAGPFRAMITTVGGGLRVLQHDGRDLVRPYDCESVRPRYAGALLAPWPNRVADGTYVFDGETHQLPITEPERGNALHGLVIWDRFEVLEHTDTLVRLVDRLVPRTGYPFEVEVEVTYTLDQATGLQTLVTGRNIGRRPAPWGAAAHPYLRPTTEHVDGCELTVPAAEVLDVTPDRLLPVRVVPVDGTDLDFRRATTVARRFVDHAYTSLRPDADGLARVRLACPAGVGVEVAWDPLVLPWVQVHTADTPERSTDRTGLAVEPMTCPPDAFNSRQDLVVLEPGQEHSASWTIAP